MFQTQKFAPAPSRRPSTVDLVAEESTEAHRRRLRIWPMLGPAFVTAIAYVDPGNFATNITAGSTYG